MGLWWGCETQSQYKDKTKHTESFLASRVGQRELPSVDSSTGQVIYEQFPLTGLGEGKAELTMLMQSLYLVQAMSASQVMLRHHMTGRTEEAEGHLVPCLAISQPAAPSPSAP